MAHIPAQEYAASAEFRRASVLAVLALLLLWKYALEDAFGGQGIDGWLRLIVATVLLGGSIAAAVLTLRWRIRLDDAGLAWRHLSAWTNWPWDDFRLGTVRKGNRYYSFLNPSQPKGRQHIAFYLLEPGKRELVMDLCKTMWHLSTPSYDRAETTIQVPRFPSPKFTIRFHPRGIQVTTQDGAHDHLWSEVQELRIIRLGHDHLRAVA
ncbi:hypothetical protein HZA57_09320, partial [Candidatus Poribacteria bacterium]|nr:hypothetical protein [Candidatus Poribacteria bacterium]